MPYTSTSSIGGSPWFGPGGCPIISPSRWQTQILNNLCVLALHDHSGSAGEGASSFSALVNVPAGQQEVISPYFPSASTGWAVDYNANWPGKWSMSSSVNGASVSYNVYLGTGLHTVRFFFGRSASNGILTACLSGGSNLASPSSIDTYASGTVYQYPTGSLATTSSGMATLQFRVYTAAEFSASGSAVTGSLVGSGKYSLVFKVSGSNPSSVGYQAQIGFINID